MVHHRHRASLARRSTAKSHLNCLTSPLTMCRSKGPMKRKKNNKFACKAIVSNIQFVSTFHSPQFPFFTFRSLSIASTHIAVRPFIIKGPHDQTVVEGSSVTFQCRVGGDPIPDILWRRTAAAGNMPLGKIYLRKLCHFLIKSNQFFCRRHVRRGVTLGGLFWLPLCSFYCHLMPNALDIHWN